MLLLLVQRLLLSLHGSRCEREFPGPAVQNTVVHEMYSPCQLYGTPFTVPFAEIAPLSLHGPRCRKGNPQALQLKGPSGVPSEGGSACEKWAQAVKVTEVVLYCTNTVLLVWYFI